MCDGGSGSDAAGELDEGGSARSSGGVDAPSGACPFLGLDFVAVCMQGFLGVNEVLCVSQACRAAWWAWSRHALRRVVGSRPKPHPQPDSPPLRRLFARLHAVYDENNARVRATPKVALPGAWEVADLSITPNCSFFSWRYSQAASGVEGMWLSFGRHKQTGEEVVLWLHNVPCGTEGGVWFYLLVTERGCVEWAVQTSDVDASAASEDVPVILGYPQRAVMPGVCTLRTGDVAATSSNPNDYVPFNVEVRDDTAVDQLMRLVEAADTGDGFRRHLERTSAALSGRCERTVYPPLFRVEGEIRSMVTHKGVANYSTGHCSVAPVSRDVFLDAARMRAQRLSRFALKASDNLRECIRQAVPTGPLSFLPQSLLLPSVGKSASMAF